MTDYLLTVTWLLATWLLMDAAIIGVFLILLVLQPKQPQRSAGGSAGMEENASDQIVRQVRDYCKQVNLDASTIGVILAVPLSQNAR